MRAVRASALLCLSLALALTSPASPAAEAVQTPLTDRENDAPAMARPPAWIDSFKDLGFDASLTLVAQRARGSGVDERALNTRADIGLTLPGGAIGKTEGKLFAHVRAGSGAGVTGNGFATPNATVFDASARPVLMEAWYQLAIPLGDPDGDRGRFEVTVGKIDPFVFFDGNNIAGDESLSFLNVAFVHDPLLDAGGDIGVGDHGSSPGVRLAWVATLKDDERLSLSLGLFGNHDAATFKKHVGLVQLDYAGKPWRGLDGTYRLYVWRNADALNQAHGLDFDGAPNLGETHVGWGISVDQRITDTVGVFACYGQSSRGTLKFDRAFNLGGQLAGAAWGRENDRLGVAVGNLRTSAEYAAAGTGSGNERIVELFYAWQASDRLEVTPGWQRIGNASGAGGDMTLWSLRARLAF